MNLAAFLPIYRDLFIGRRDDYAVQLSNGRYRRVGKPLSDLDITDHLLGVRTYGTYMIDETGCCRFTVLDADTEAGAAALVRLQAELAQEGRHAYLEASRRGVHLWSFFKEPIPASRVRAWLVPHCPGGVELYPKQDESRHGYGALMRLPLGVHRLSGKRYGWLSSWSPETGAVPVARSLEETASWLAQVERVMPPDLEPATPTTPHSDRPTPLPSHTIDNPIEDPPPSLQADHPQHPTIAEWCAAQDPFALIGRYVTLSARGVGCCPFGEHHAGGIDRHASFKVYQPSRPGGCSWWCYAWGKGGNVFNFLSYWYRLDARTLWQRIQAGEAF